MALLYAVARISALLSIILGVIWFLGDASHALLGTSAILLAVGTATLVAMRWRMLPIRLIACAINAVLAYEGISRLLASADPIRGRLAMIWGVFFLSLAVLNAVGIAIPAPPAVVHRRKLDTQRRQANGLLSDDLKAERKGQWERATRIYGEVVRQSPGTTYAEDAEMQIAVLQKEGKVIG